MGMGVASTCPLVQSNKIHQQGFYGCPKFLFVLNFIGVKDMIKRRVNQLRHPRGSLDPKQVCFFLLVDLWTTDNALWGFSSKKLLPLIKFFVTY